MAEDEKQQAEAGAGEKQASGGPPDPEAAQKSSELASEVEKGKSQRWQDQCFLIDGIDFLSDKYSETAYYQNIIPIGGNPQEAVSVITGEPNAGTFFKLTPAQLSLLVPTIKLYIVEYNIKGGLLGVREVHKEGQLKEIYFEDFTRESDIQDILTTSAGRGSGAGIKSFTYTFDGKDPATIDKSITATLKMLFTDTNILTRKQPNGVSFLDLVTRIQKQIPKTGKRTPPDLANPSSFCVKPQTKGSRTKTSSANLVLNPEYRRIKAKIGWAPPRGANAEKFFSESFFAEGGASTFNSKGLIELLERMQLELFLEMTTHSLDFKNDGRIELTVNYRASIEGELLSPEANLFYEMSQKIKDLDRDAADKKEETADKQKEKIEKKDVDDDDKKEAADEAKEANKAVDDSVGLQKDMLRYKTYQEFLKKLILGGNIWSVHVSGEDLKAWMGSGAEKHNTKNDYAKARSVGSARITAASILKKEGTKISKVKGDTSAYKTIMKGLEKAQKENDPDDAADSRKDAAAETKAASKDAEETSDEKTEIEDKDIFYVFFGDILDVAMTTFVNNMQKKRDIKMRMMVSKMTMISPESGKPTNIAITDIPIALDEFILWFNNKVIKPMRNQYMLLDFIQDIMTNLIAQSLGFNCFDGVGKVLPELNLIPIQYPLMEKGKEPILRGVGQGVPKDRYPRVDISALKRKFGKSKSSHGPASSYVNYIVMHASVKAGAAMDPTNIKQDERNGIYHLGLGLDRGIVKEIKFKASKIKHAAETRIIDQGMANLGQLFEKYDADVITYGCSLFKTGQYIYIDPRTMGVSSDIARLLGLGGYYVIVKTTGELSSDGYFLTLDSKFQNNGVCKGEQAPQEKNPTRDYASFGPNEPISKDAPKRVGSSKQEIDAPRGQAAGVTHDQTRSNPQKG